MNLPEIIRTPRLRLRKPLIEDAHEVFRNYASDPEATRFLAFTTHRKVEDAFEAMLTRLAHWEQGTEFSWSITPPGDSPRVMGMISASPDARRGWCWSLGYTLGREWWDQGFMTEAVRAVTAQIFSNPGVLRVWAWVDEENYASMRVLEKSGFAREGILRRWSLHPQMGATPRDCWAFSILR
ncbi:MAG: GNAT family N-acetyltransferase [Chthoniobacteraceae bacterium]